MINKWLFIEAGEIQSSHNSQEEAIKAMKARRKYLFTTTLDNFAIDSKTCDLDDLTALNSILNYLSDIANNPTDAKTFSIHGQLFEIKFSS